MCFFLKALGWSVSGSCLDDTQVLPGAVREYDVVVVFAFLTFERRRKANTANILLNNTPFLSIEVRGRW